MSPEWFVAFVFVTVAALSLGVTMGWRWGRQDHRWAKQAFQQLMEHGMKTYKLEVKAHFDDPGKQKAMEEACKDAARNLLSVAILLSAPRSTPEAMVQTEDWIEGVTVHDLDTTQITS